MYKLLLIPFFLLIVGGNVLWYWIKEELKKHGYEVYYFHSHLNDLSNFSDLIKKTSDPDTKAFYNKMRGYLNVIFILLFGGFAVFILGLIITN